MGCGQQKRLVQISPPANIASQTVSKTRAKAKTTKHDWHCNICGQTRPYQPSRLHKCPGQIAPIPYQVERQNVCNECPNNKEGVCEVIRIHHFREGKPALISVGISMPQVRCPQGRWERVLFSCDRCGSQCFDAHGLTVCPVCFPTASVLRNGKLYYRDPPQPKITPRHKYAVVTAAVGMANDYFVYTEPLIRDYAKRVGADFHVIRDDASPDWPMANKWRVGQYAKHYEKTLWLDADVIVKPTAPNIFTVTDRFAAQDELPYRHDKQNIEAESKSIAKSLGLPNSAEWQPNGGVLVIPNTEIDRYAPPRRPVPNYWTLDQVLIALQNRKQDIHILDDRWNWGYIRNDFWEGLEDAWFIHANGSRPDRYRIQLLQQLVTGNYSRLYPPDNVWQPAWTLKHD